MTRATDAVRAVLSTVAERYPSLRRRMRREVVRDAACYAIEDGKPTLENLREHALALAADAVEEVRSEREYDAHFAEDDAATSWADYYQDCGYTI